MSNEHDPIVVTGTASSGGLALLEGRWDPALNRYDFRGLGTTGRRNLSYGSGSFVLDRGQDPRQALAAVAGRIPAADDPAADDPAEGAAALIAESLSWRGEAAACRNHFAAIVGPSTLAIAGCGSNVSWLTPIDVRFGAHQVEVALTRMPVLAGALRVLATDHPEPSTVEAGLRILSGDDLSLGELAGHVLTILRDPCACLVGGLRGPVDPIPAPESASPELDLRRNQVAALLRAMGHAAAHPDFALRALLTCHRVPRDWMPRDTPSLEAMSEVMEAAAAVERFFEGGLRIETLLGPVHGDWKRVRDRLASIKPRATSLRDWTIEINDMARAYDRQVLRPAESYAKALLREPPDHPPRNTDHGFDEGRCRSQALASLFGGKGLIALAEANAEWHRRSGAMNASVAGLSGRSGTAFPRQFPDFRDEEGFTVTPILGTRDLAAEGAAMRHCVGSYGHGCRRGSYAIVSVRAPDGTRLSTAQVRGRGTRVSEHKGFANGPPPPGAAAVLAAFLSHNARALQEKGRWALARRMLALPDAAFRGFLALIAPAWVKAYPYDPRDPSLILAAAALWEPFVKRPERGSLSAILQPHRADLARRLAQSGELRPLRSAADLPLGVARLFWLPFSHTARGIAAMIRPLSAVQRGLVAVFCIILCLMGGVTWMAFDEHARIIEAEQARLRTFRAEPRPSVLGTGFVERDGVIYRSDGIPPPVVPYPVDASRNGR